MTQIPWFIAGLAVGLLLAISIRYIFPGLLRDNEIRHLKNIISELEDRLEKKDELIRKAIKASGDQS